MIPESDYIMLSALQHYMFCPRQCALIHIEQQWFENRYTAEGQVLHERADSNKSDTAGNIRIVRTLPLCSHRLGITGQADVVEFHQDGTVLPVEYKRGKPKANRCDEVQLCAQALCLEEMLNTKIADGALFYGKRRRRTVIVFDATLRKLTEQVVAQVHHLLNAGVTPPASYSPQCDSCSLLNICLPHSCAKGRSVKQYMERILRGEQ
ncbi:MAG: CRISPR-associated protein Cas4 [Desulfuromonas sp.]|nr:CRISPR-associated protein Cas4 [Desulfuromonas sp.]